MGEKVMTHLAVKFDFRASWTHSLTPFDCTDHSAYTTLNLGPGGIRELTIDADKLEQVLKYRKVSFPESVSTTFVAHCLESINVNCGDFRYISKL